MFCLTWLLRPPPPPPPIPRSLLPLLRWKGVDIESVAWDVGNTDTNSTGTFLIGTADGQIYETVIESKKCKKFTSVRLA